MSRFIIHGPTQLHGQVDIRGAKNAALPILIAATAGSGVSHFQNVPTELNDIHILLESLDHLGFRTVRGDGNIEIDGSSITTTVLPGQLSGKFRYSLVLLGALVGKYGHAKISYPGGCNLGDRKFDLHLKGLRALGADVKTDESTIEVSAKELVGTDIDFYLPTTSGTETVILAACFAKGRTRIFNANTRPEIESMAKYLNHIGANISVKNRVVEIEGGRPMTSGSFPIMKGWDEALTYIIAAGMTGGEICITDFSLDHIQADIVHLRTAGLDIFEWGGNVYASGKDRPLRSFDLFTAPYPGVNSDMQPLFAALAGVCKGESSVTDQRFSERFQYTEELQKLGVQIDSYGNCAIISGPSTLKGADVTALDLRCGAALILGGLAADGTTTIENSYQIERGYEYVVPRFSALGANIARMDDIL